MIKDFTPRLYQETILATATQKNTLVVLPTGLGKTNIFLMLAAHRLSLYPNSKILLIGPTKPLIDQYLQVFEKHFSLPKEKYAIFTGEVRPEKRAELWKTAQIFFSTPQGLENDIINKRINLEEVSLLGVDEAHRAVGDYAYVFVAKQYYELAKYPRILALTASPGSDIEKIKEVCQNLFIESIEVRTEKDYDVRPYVQKIDISWIPLDLPPLLLEIKKDIELFLKERSKKLKEMNIIPSADLHNITKKDILSLSASLRGRVASGEPDPNLWNAISIIAEFLKIYHSLELLETQGIPALYKYFTKLQEESISTKTKAVRNIVKDELFKSALYKTKKLYEEGIEHPKLIELQKIVSREMKENPQSKILIFNQYRDNAQDIIEKISKINGVKASIFVGQQKKGETGMSQKEQKEILDKFRTGEFNILVATSIAEEGLDIPKVDLVIFFEPIPSAIRHIQRRGRTGRGEKGRVIILMTKNTRDEAYKWSAHHKEKKMYAHLENIKSMMGFILHKKTEETSLTKFIPQQEKVVIYADYREKDSGVIKELINLKADLTLEKLETADFVVSPRCAIEYKKIPDFVDSIIDKRLLIQIKELKNNFSRPLIIIEGIEDIYSIRNVHQNAIMGMLATISVSYGIPILYTKHSKETAKLIYIIAKREQEETTKDFSPHTEKKPLTIKESQEYIVSALPGVGPSLAKTLLKKFKTVKKIINAKEEKLQKIKNIGPIIAKRIKEVIETEYKDE